MTDISEKRLVFIGTTTETFTPTTSGAVATVMWELSRCAQADGIEPFVIARRSDKEAHADVRALFFDYPTEPEGGAALLVRRAQRKVMGWTRIRQGEWMARVAGILRAEGLEGEPWVLNNEPELAVYLRRQFPGAFMVHLFHNVLPCKAGARGEFGKAVNVSAGVSDFIARWVEREFRLPGNSVATLYNAVDCDRFRPADAPPAGVPVINYVGRTGCEKAPDILLKACLKLAERTKEFAVQIVGANHWGRLEMDDYQRELQTMIGELKGRGVEVRVTGHVSRNKIQEEFRRAHIHVVPSRCEEAFGLSALEGMASGLATVGSRVGGIPEVIGDAGFLFENENAGELSQILERLINFREMRSEYGARARRRAEGFSWSRTWNQMSNLLQLSDNSCMSASSI